MFDFFLKSIQSFQLTTIDWLLFVLVFLIFVTPFVLQNIYSEPDYSIRIGLIEISNEKRFFLLTYLLKKLLSFEFFPFLLFAFLSFFYTNNYSRKYVKKLNIFFYLIISSILSTIIFISLSPSIISVYHFADIILFSLALYFSLILFTATYEFINTKKFSNILFSDSAIIVFFVIFLLFDGLYSIKEHEKKKELIKEADKLEIFLVDEGLNNTNLKLFTNDRIASNFWLLNGNNNLLISSIGIFNLLLSPCFASSNFFFKSLISPEPPRTLLYFFCVFFTLFTLFDFLPPAPK